MRLVYYRLQALGKRGERVSARVFGLVECGAVRLIVFLSPQAVWDVTVNPGTVRARHGPVGCGYALRSSRRVVRVCAWLHSPSSPASRQSLGWAGPRRQAAG